MFSPISINSSDTPSPQRIVAREDLIPELSDFVTDIDDIIRTGNKISEFYKKDPLELTLVAKDVKKQLTKNPFAVIDIKQKMNAEKKCHQLVSAFLTDKSRKFKTETIPTDIIQLLCTYYPLFYWNNEYISLQSHPRNDNADTFIVPKECCELAGFLQSFIDNESASSSIVNVENIDNEILELLVRYITNMFYWKLYARNSAATESNYFVMMIWNEIQKWEEIFVDELNEKTLKQLHDAANQMECKSLTDLTEKKLRDIEAYKAQANLYPTDIQNILNAHFQSS